MSRYLLNLPSAGIVNDIGSLFVNDITIEKYLDIVKLRHSYNNAIGKMLLSEYIEDKSLIPILPAADKEFIATNMFVECFSDSVSVNLKCPVCDSQIKESFNIANYEYYFLEPKDKQLFFQKINNKEIKLTLPLDIKSEYKITDYIDSVEGEPLNEYDISELEYIVRGDIEMNCGIVKQYSIICNACGVEILTSKPYGLYLLEVAPDRVLEERKNIYSILNMFSYAAHQPSGDLIKYTLKDLNIRLDLFLEMKQKENDQIKG